MGENNRSDVAFERTPGGIDAARAWLRKLSSPAAVADIPPPYLRYSDASVPNKEHRILGVFRMWGTIAYSSPYRSLIKNWDAGALEAFAEMGRATTSEAYDSALRRYYARLNDSHGFMYGPDATRRFGRFPPIISRQIGRHVVVTAAAPDAIAANVRVGDIVDAVDGEPTSLRANRLVRFLAASTPQSRAEILNSMVLLPTLFAGPEGSNLRLTIHGANLKQRTISLRRGVFPDWLTHRPGPAIQTLARAVVYADLTRTTNDDLVDLTGRLTGAHALVIDLRGYPRSDNSLLAEHLVKAPTPFALFETPFIEFPQDVAVTDENDNDVSQQDAWRRIRMVVTPIAPHFRGQVVVLIDARAVSAAEYSIMQFAATGAVLVGEPTSGADGDITAFCIPGAYTLNFSGSAIRFPDGRPTQGIGIQPDIVVRPTIGDIRAGRDAVLSAGLKIAVVQRQHDPEHHSTHGNVP